VAAPGVYVVTGIDAALGYSGFVAGVPGGHPLCLLFDARRHEPVVDHARHTLAFDLVSRTLDLES
jgi:hypothetical protein